MRMLPFRLGFVAILAGATISPALCAAKPLSAIQQRKAQAAGYTAALQAVERQQPPLPSPLPPQYRLRYVSICVAAAMAKKLDRTTAKAYCKSAVSIL